MNDRKDIEPMESLSITLPDRLFDRLEAYATASRRSISFVVESALAEFLTLVEGCDSDARDVARNLTLEDL